MYIHIYIYIYISQGYLSPKYAGRLQVDSLHSAAWRVWASIYC